jgi:thymidylate kinase
MIVAFTDIDGSGKILQTEALVDLLAITRG